MGVFEDVTECVGKINVILMNVDDFDAGSINIELNVLLKKLEKNYVSKEDVKNIIKKYIITGAYPNLFQDILNEIEVVGQDTQNKEGDE